MDFRSRLIAFLKVLLPLCALALMSTLFLLSRGSETDGVIPFAETEIDERLRDQVVSRPFYSGNTRNGDEIIVEATAVRQNDQNPTQADTFFARLRSADGTSVTVTSDMGSFDIENDQVTLTGDVVIRDATGMIIETDTLVSALEKIEASTPGQIKGQGPIGNFTAGAMEVVSSEKDDIHLVFKNGVNLIYRPKPNER